MTQQEFEERTGLKVTGDEFEKVNAIYMAAGDMDKDRFCADYRKHKDCEIIEVLFEKADGLSDKLHVYQKELDNIADFLIDKAEQYSSSEMRRKAIAILGEREFLRRKINKGYTLCKSDREFLNDILLGELYPPRFANINK